MQNARALIFANGDQIDLPAVQKLIRPGDWPVAADNGLRHLRALGLEPALVIGDLDSIAPEEIDRLRAKGTRVLQFPVHKDETDLELAILKAVEEGYQTILILAALGGRLDMTLANICLLALPELANCDARLEDGLEEVFLIHSGAGGREILGRAGDRVSLLPFSGPAYGVRTQGLYYPLNNETLLPERSRGISNKMVAERAVVSLETGLLICIHTRREHGDSSSLKSMEA